jgi:hypothetical protein
MYSIFFVIAYTLHNVQYTVNFMTSYNSYIRPKILIMFVSPPFSDEQ